MGKILVIHDVERVSVGMVKKSLEDQGLEATVINISEEPLNVGVFRDVELAIFISINPYTALGLSRLTKVSINNFDGILNALSIPRLLALQGIDFTVVSGDEAVKKVQISGSTYFNTLWSMELGGFIDSIEGARSVLEYRQYMRNPLVKASVLVNVSGPERKVFATIQSPEYGDVLRRLNLQFAELTLIGSTVVEANPTPDIPNDRVVEVSEIVRSYVKGR